MLSISVDRLRIWDYGFAEGGGRNEGAEWDFEVGGVLGWKGTRFHRG